MGCQVRTRSGFPVMVPTDATIFSSAGVSEHPTAGVPEAVVAPWNGHFHFPGSIRTGTQPAWNPDGTEKHRSPLF